jgi:hypothetical protein
MQVYAIGLALFSTAALAQEGSNPSRSDAERDKAFNEIGKSLEQMERTIAPPMKGPIQYGGNSQPSNTSSPSGLDLTGPNAAIYQLGQIGSEVTAAVPIGGRASPNASAPVVSILPTGTPARVQGVENGFIKLVPIAGATSGQTVYVPQEAIQAGYFTTYVGDKVSQLMNQVRNLAKTLEDNPYVRLKGFKIGVSVSPSLDVEFEMKGNESPVPRASNTP